VATLIETKTGHMFLTNLSLAEVKTAMELDQPIDIWWYASYGQRYSEKLLISRDEVAWIRTESEDQ
jgi:hypothetical protein